MTNFFLFFAFNHLYIAICLWFSANLPSFFFFGSHTVYDIRQRESRMKHEWIIWRKKNCWCALENVFQSQFQHQCIRNIIRKHTAIVCDALHCHEFIWEQFLFHVQTSESILFLFAFAIQHNSSINFFNRCFFFSPLPCVWMFYDTHVLLLLLF